MISAVINKLAPEDLHDKLFCPLTTNLFLAFFVSFVLPEELLNLVSCNLQNMNKYIVAFLLIFIALVRYGVSQTPTPTPVQYPNVPNDGNDLCAYVGQPPCPMIARDDVYVYRKPNQTAELFWARTNDTNAGELYLYSQSLTLGTMAESSCYCGTSTSQRLVIGYANNIIPGVFGADIGTYYTKSYFGAINKTFVSNLATVAIFVVPQDGAENAGYSCPIIGQPVNASNGNMWLQQTDYSLPGIGDNIEINRFYNSVIQTSGLFGFGWSTKYDESLWFYDDKMLRLNMPDGRAVYFGRNNTTAPFTSISPDIYGNIIKNTDNTYTLTFKDGRIHKFRANGRLDWQKDRNGNQTTLSYNVNNNLIGITDAFGRTLTVTPNANGTAASVSDSISTIATYEYELNTSKLKTVTYSDGSKYKFEYDTTTVSGKVLLKTVKDANDNILETHAYDPQGRATTSEKQGGIEKYTFNYLNASETDVTDANQKVSKYYFDKSNGRNVVTKTEGVCSCGGSGSEVTQYFYDDKLNLTKKVDALNREMTYTYDPNGNRLTQTQKVGTTDLGTDTFTYNSFGQVLTWTDKMSGVTTNTYDANGNLKTTTDALGKVTTVAYPAANNKGLPDSMKDARNNLTKFKWFPASGLLQEVEDANLKKTNYTYDARGRTKTVTNALGYVTSYNYYDDAQRKVEMIYPNADKITYKYDVRRLLESMTDERGKVTNYTFDNAYRLTKITDPLLHIKEYDYDLMSNLKLTKDGLGNQTDYNYDDFNRLREIKYPLAEASAAARLTETFAYDPTGRIKQVTDTAGRNTVYDYYDAERRNTVTNTDGEVTTTRYNARNQMIQVTDAKNQVYDFTYDPLGQMLTQTHAGGTMSYQYDEVGNRQSRVDYLGRNTRYIYDKLNRLEKIFYIGVLYFDGINRSPTPIQTATYTYDEISRLKTATNDAGTVSFNYDNRNRIKDTTDVFGHFLEYDYALTSTTNQRSLKFDNAPYAQYNYDDANRLANILNSADNSTISFGYDNANRMTSRNLPNNITTTYDYDNINRLKRLKDTSSTATLFDRNYRYNTASQIDQISEPSQIRTFGYDNVDRLMSMTNGTANESYNYDDVGNRTSSHRSASYNYQTGQFNRVSATASANYGYDANGNMTTKAEGKELWRFTWDYENRLTMASTRRQTMRYRYDALGRRVQRYFAGTKENTKFIYDGQDVLVDDNSGTLTKYINGEGIDNKLRVQTGSDVKYFLADHLGSTNALTDTSGNITSSASYDSFGNATGNLSTRYQFTGREFDNFTGLQYSRARFYDANLGRFISEDPIGFRGGDINLYGYVINNPVTYKDPSGLDITVIENGSTSGNPLGHTALSVSGCGLITFGNADPNNPGRNAICGDFNEYINREATRRDSVIYTIPTTPEQDRAAIDKALEIDYWRFPLELKTIAMDNCSLRSNQILDAAGIQNNRLPDIFPGSAGRRAYNLGANPYYVLQGENADVLSLQAPYWTKHRIF